MRELFRVVLVIVLFLVATPQSSDAQRTTEPAAEMGERAPASVRFRPRTNEERLATLRRLDAANNRRAAGAAGLPRPAPNPPLVLNVALNDAFSVTPRTPFVPAQGSLMMVGAGRVDPRWGAAGDAMFASGGYVRLRIENPARRRLLIECTVFVNNASASTTFRGDLSTSHSPIWHDVSGLHDNVISFLTPPIAQNTGPSFEFTVERTYSAGAGHWHLFGCEVTRAAL